MVDANVIVAGAGLAAYKHVAGPMLDKFFASLFSQPA
jgi:hypothetical protein